jgi:hypothetical protein
MNHELDVKAVIRKRNTDVMVDGRILWEDLDSFGFEMDFYDTPATMVCYYDDWEIIRKYNT